LKEVITEVIRRDLHHAQYIDEFITITRVEITRDLAYAKVFITVIGDDKKKKQALGALRAQSKRIAVIASKKVVMRYFPELDFLLDDGLEKQLRVEELLHKASDERAHRKPALDE
jgi:ribosome-binding factor A